MRTRSSQRLLFTLVAQPMLVIGVATGCERTPTTLDALAASPEQPFMAKGGNSGNTPASVMSGLAEIRRVTAPYHNVNKALAAGYRINPQCVSSPLGVMGHHFANPSLLYDAEIDLLKPEVLLYERKPNGSFHLIGVEYFVLKSQWEAANGIGAAPPVLLGQTFPLSDHPPFGKHYELHVWVWEHNPLGMFEPYNPKVSC